MLGNKRHVSATAVRVAVGALLFSTASANAQLARGREWRDATSNAQPANKDCGASGRLSRLGSSCDGWQNSDPAKRPLIAVDWRSELPSAAQEAVKMGILAAKQQEWQIAIEKFQHARQLAPKAPELYGYLGLAESKIPGRELRAIAWFGAYLAVIRHPDNEAAVKEQIGALQIKGEANIDRILKAAENAALKIPIKKSFYGKVNGRKILLSDGASDRKGGLADVAKLYARFGNVTQAMRILTASKIGLNTTTNYGVVGWLIEYGGEDGIAAVRTLLAHGNQYDQKYYGSAIHGQIAVKEAENGDIAAAWQDANAMSGSVNFAFAGNKISALIAIAEAENKAGHKAESRKTLLRAKDYAHKMKSEDWPRIYSRLTKAQAAVGDIEGAKSTLDLIPDSHGSKNYNRLEIAEAQVRAGDIVGANKTAESISDSGLRRQLQDEIDQAKRAALANNNKEPLPVEENDWLKKFNNNNWDPCPLDSAAFTDLRGYLRSLPTGSPRQTSDALDKAAAKIYAAHEVVAKLLKQQFKQNGEP